MRESFTLPRHRHRTPYASVVLSGTLDEAGFNGRIQARAGDVLIHPAFDSHCNSRVLTGLRLIRLNWSDRCFLSGLFQITDLDPIAILAERDPAQASLLLSESLGRHPVPSSNANNDWPDLLAAQLRRNHVQSIGGWARRHQLAPETVSRGFALAYGVTPQVFRAEARALLAWQRISAGAGALAAIAVETGFADQAHMTRWVRRISGAAPRAWRRPPPAGHSPAGCRPSAEGNRTMQSP